ncbi:hypothetical protein [Sphingomonas sp.]|uniref:hypothetical protein n=1 Tax=Sphingomonas sp. TaxID=28214 RepID=UPI00307E9C8C
MPGASHIHRQHCRCARCAGAPTPASRVAPCRPTWASAWLLGCATGAVIVLAIAAAGGPSLCVLIGGAP